MSRIHIKGMLFTLIFAIPAALLGWKFPLIGGPVFGILLGMIFAGIKRPPTFEPGITYTGKQILQYSIVLLGFEMNLMHVVHTGARSFSVMVFTLATAFIVAFVFGKLLKLPFNTTTLVGVGTAICGGSAIAAVAPIIKANEKDVAYSISTIFLFNIIAVFLFPFLGHMMHMSDSGFGMWAGTAINDTSSVVAAGYSYSAVAGGLATITKLTRALMIVPVCIIIATIMAKRQKGDNAFSLRKVFPNFILYFIIASIISTVGNTVIPHSLLHFLGEAGKFFIVVAMTAIGLHTHLLGLIRNGLRPIVLGLLCWFGVASVSLIVQHVIGMV
ncbi:YeiH family protein [uncultured Megasphaera sp.]|uniref:YeiH family protein n=1 Tax=uncultured Megasphaera sp. TaxID=165188 RepID=UPI0012E2FDEC|nr:YeiH family protein [uncultured Megasphaera sp.]MUP48715.1 putative sulfate exporter family transporter [Veillonellaceae bacterium M2-8]